MTRGFLKFRNIRDFRSRLGLAPLCDPGSYRVQAGSTAAHNAQSLLWPRPGATLSPGSWRVQRVPERTGEAAPTSTYTGPFREDLGSLIHQLACCRHESLKQGRQNDRDQNIFLCEIRTFSSQKKEGGQGKNQSPEEAVPKAKFNQVN